MIRFKVFQDKREQSETKGKWYARAVADEVINMDKLAKHMANHNTPFSKGTIKGILTDMVACIQELALEGKAVKIDDLGIFSVGIITKPADSAKEFNVTQNVKGFRLRCRATGVMRPQVIGKDVELKEADIYTVDAVEKETAKEDAETKAGGDVENG